jgi:UDP-N-acetylmuramoyl-tripeptide--D-alanyl-D-alanine ligase
VEPRTLQFIAQACAGEQLTGRPDAVVRRVCTDSRQVQEGDLFVALRGGRFDGHRFLGEVAGKKAVAAVVERSDLPVPPPSMALVAVENTRLALGRLGASYRRDFPAPIIAVGGSNGKSTTKELIASVVRQRYSTLWSEASFNNDIGVPMTLLRLERRHEAAVLEVGTNHPGELAPLLAMVQPSFGVMTSLGPEHLEFFGDMEGVLREEGVLAESLPAEGRFFLNMTGEHAVRLVPRSRAPVVEIGLDARHAWSVRRLAVDERGSTFEVKAPQPEFCGEYRVNLLGRHQVLNALLAVAVGATLGVPAPLVRRGLAECQPLKLRLQLWEAGGVRVLDDCYNANLDSMIAALQTLAELPCSGRRLAVLGDMAELGGQGAFAHAEVGRRAAQARLSQLFTIGPMSRLTAEAARLAGLGQVREFDHAAQAARALRRLVRRGDLVLLKASRVAGLEQVGEALRAAGAGQDTAQGVRSAGPAATTGEGSGKLSASSPRGCAPAVC